MASFICGSAKGMAGSGLPGHPGHQRGARVALQRCPILRLVRLKCIQMPKLMPKTSQKTPQKTLDTTSALIDELFPSATRRRARHSSTFSSAPVVDRRPLAAYESPAGGDDYH